MNSRLIGEMAASYGMDIGEFTAAVKAQCFPVGAASDPQFLMLLSVAHRYDLNPLVRELHAFINKEGKMEITVGVDGWCKMVSRDPRVCGWVPEEERDAAGGLVAITVKLYRRDWKLDDGTYLPGIYRAKLDEWLVEHKQGKAPTNWEEMPEHRLFGVALKECARRTLGITEVIGEVDEMKLRRVDEQGSPVTPKAIENRPDLPLRVKVDLPVEVTQQGSPVTPQGSPVTPKKERNAKQSEADEPASQSLGGESAGDPPAGDSPQPSTEVMQIRVDLTPTEREILNNESPLVTFIRVHDVPDRRVKLQLAKYGVTGLGALTAEQQAEILATFEKSYGGTK